MITDEQIKEMQWQSGIYQLKKGCKDLLDEIERAESEKRGGQRNYERNSERG